MISGTGKPAEPKPNHWINSSQGQLFFAGLIVLNGILMGIETDTREYEIWVHIELAFLVVRILREAQLLVLVHVVGGPCPAVGRVQGQRRPGAELHLFRVRSSARRQWMCQRHRRLPAR